MREKILDYSMNEISISSRAADFAPSKRYLPPEFHSEKYISILRVVQIVFQ